MLVHITYCFGHAQQFERSEIVNVSEQIFQLNLILCEIMVVSFFDAYSDTCRELVNKLHTKNDFKDSKVHAMDNRHR